MILSQYIGDLNSFSLHKLQYSGEIGMVVSQYLGALIYIYSIRKRVGWFCRKMHELTIKLIRVRWFFAILISLAFPRTLYVRVLLRLGWFFTIFISSNSKVLVQYTFEKDIFWKKFYLTVGWSGWFYYKIPQLKCILIRERWFNLNISQPTFLLIRVE